MTHHHAQRGNAFLWILLLLIVAAGLVYYFYFREDGEEALETPPPPPIVTEAPEETAPRPAPEPQRAPPSEPVEDVAPEETEPLPALVESDAQALGTAEDLIGPDAVREHLVTEGVLPRLVAAINALTLDEMPENILPIRAAVGAFEVTPDGVSEQINPETGLPVPRYVLDPANFTRYRAQVEILESLDSRMLADRYRHYYPLLQQSYRELGYPEGEFEGRLLEVIDHLLATPEPERPVRLIKPEAFYEFADPKLEALSAGQKILIRIGPSNAARVKAKLREIRAAIQTQRE